MVSFRCIGQVWVRWVLSSFLDQGSAVSVRMASLPVQRGEDDVTFGFVPAILLGAPERQRQRNGCIRVTR